VLTGLAPLRNVRMDLFQSLSLPVDGHPLPVSLALSMLLLIRTLVILP
jgi:hypothetical protein